MTFEPGDLVVVKPSAPRKRDGFRAKIMRIDHHGDLHLCVTDTYNGSGRHPQAGVSRVLHPDRVRPLKETR